MLTRRLDFLLGAFMVWASHAASAAALPLPTLISTMQDSPAIQASRHEEQEIGVELLQRKERAGWSVFGNVSAGNYRELERAGKERYRGTASQVGLRYPLLGAMQARQAVIVDAKIALEQARQTTALARAEQQQLLRQAYIDWWRQAALDEWCAQHQALAASEKQKAINRTQQQQLRLSEQLWVEQRWANLLHVCSDLPQRDTVLRQRLGYLHGQAIPPKAFPEAEPLPTKLAPLADWAPLLEQHPSLLIHRSEEEALQELDKGRWTDRVEAHFSISQQFDRRTDISGHGGGTVVGFTFEVPLASLTAGSRAGLGEARQVAARYRVLDTRQHLLHVLDQTLQQYHQTLGQLERRSEQVQRMHQLVTEQQARLQIDDEVGFMNLRLAMVDLAEAKLEMINDWHAGWSTLAQLQVVSEGPLPTHTAQTRDWKPLQAHPAPPPPAGKPVTAKPTVTTHPDPTWRNAAYVWDSSALLDKQKLSAEIRALKQAGFNHVHLGFNASQVSQLNALGPEIGRLANQLEQQGLSVGLLLGDPDWMLVEHRQGLLQLLDRFAQHPFTELHLDLEVEQLGWPVPDSLLQGWLDTLEQVAQRSPWPVSIVSHHRWFAADQRNSEHCIPCALPDMGINNATLMLYSTGRESVVERTAAMLQAWPELDLHLAQSVEAALGPQNSWSGASPSELQAVNAYLRKELQTHGLAGVAWQDWAEYPREPSETARP